MSEEVKATAMDAVSYDHAHVEPFDGKLRVYFSNSKHRLDYVEVYIDNQGELTIMSSHGRLYVIPQASNMVKVRPE